MTLEREPDFRNGLTDVIGRIARLSEVIERSSYFDVTRTFEREILKITQTEWFDLIKKNTPFEYYFAHLQQAEGLEDGLRLLKEMSRRLLVAKKSSQNRKPALPNFRSASPSGINKRRVLFWPSIGEHLFSKADSFDALVNDWPRLQAYQKGLQNIVAGKVVLDICNSSDILIPQICLKYGAKRVYTLKLLENEYEEVLLKIKNSPFRESITALFGEPSIIDFDEKVDLCVTDCFGSIGSLDGITVLLKNVHRHLSSEGAIFPGQCTTLVAAVSMPDRELMTNPVFGGGAEYWIDQMFSVRRKFFNPRIVALNVRKSDVISTSDVFEQINLNSLESLVNERQLRMEITRDGLIDGFILWISLSNEGTLFDPLSAGSSSFPVQFFPVFYPGIRVQQGDVIEATAFVQISADNWHPDYRLTGKIQSSNGDSTSFEYFSPVHSNFKGSEFFSSVFKSYGFTA